MRTKLFLLTLIVFLSANLFSQSITLPYYTIRGDRIKSILGTYALIEMRFTGLITSPTITILGYVNADGTGTATNIFDFSAHSNPALNNHSGKPNIANKVQCYGDLGLADTRDWDWVPTETSTYYMVPQLVYDKKDNVFYVHFRVKEQQYATSYCKSLNPIPPASPGIVQTKKKKVH